MNAEATYKQTCNYDKQKELLTTEQRNTAAYDASIRRIQGEAAATTIQSDPNLSSSLQTSISNWERVCSAAAAPQSAKDAVSKNMAS